MRSLVAVAAATSLSVTSAASQPPNAGGTVPPIRDNSFLVEEAYNQESRVVQHISALVHDQRSGLWSYTFTQEWPAPGVRHQLSYTIPIANQGGPGRRGIGDLALNYRYQLAGAAEGARVAFAPRLTAILPTGSVSRGLGRGGAGVEINLPLSVELTPWLVSHSNAGYTLTPRARSESRAGASLSEFNVGQSLIWLALPTFNVMVESTLESTEEIVGPSSTSRRLDWVIAPALRKAFNFRSGLQIVPGLAVPFGFGDEDRDPVLLVYLSFEHPF